LIDEIRVYSGALTHSQIQTDMNTPVTAETQPPTAPGILTATAMSTNLGVVTLDIGSGSLVTIREPVERLFHLVDPSLIPVLGAIEARPHEMVRSAEITMTEKMIGWRPRTLLCDGLATTVEWYTLANPRLPRVGFRDQSVNSTE